MESIKQFQVTETDCASIGQRLGNYLVDMIMIIIIMFIMLVFFITTIKIGDNAFMENFAKNSLAQYTLAACAILFYYNIFEIFSARTIGKLITQTVVVDANGEKPNQETILIRSLCRLIPFDNLSLLINGSKAWHDGLSKTYVVDKKQLEESKRKFYSLQETKKD